MARQVLVVEAPDERAPSLHLALSQRGFSVHSSHDVQEAVAWAVQHQPDLVWLAGPPSWCAAFKLHPHTNLLALVRQRGRGDASALQVAPDSFYSGERLEETLDRVLCRALAARARRLREGIRAEVRFLLPSDAGFLDELSQLLVGWCSSCGLSNHQARQFNLAIREVAANAIEWGHNHERHRIVHITGRLDAEKVSVVVRDTGPGFDPGNLPHAARPGDPVTHLEIRAARQLREGGFGILLATGLADHLWYNDTGNEAQLIKYLPSHVCLETPVEVILPAPLAP